MFASSTPTVPTFHDVLRGTKKGRVHPQKRSTRLLTVYQIDYTKL